ncbi:hypothetical protein GCM10022381_14900 [Leifsonia kafniensis]|uniref:N-acetyltransferase domain-containing protein n=1 Tax=Leifsonia kafniensis TaxID=475957 RepID=A0ABP7KCI6_9MICO
MTIDTGHADDLDACVALWILALTAREAAPPVVGTAERARGKLAHDPVSWRVLRDEQGSVCGFGLITAPATGSPSDPPAAVYVSLLAIDPALQGRGHGAALLTELLADARKAGHATAVLHVLTSNVAATQLYLSTGWRAAGAAFAHPLSGLPSQTFILDLTEGVPRAAADADATPPARLRLTRE